MSDNTQQTKNAFADTVDAVIRRIGHVLMWANCIVIFFIILQVVLRYGFGHGLVLLEELQWHFYGVAFMFGLSYAVVTDSHVGMDLVYDRAFRQVEGEVGHLRHVCSCCFPLPG